MSTEARWKSGDVSLVIATANRIGAGTDAHVKLSFHKHTGEAICWVKCFEASDLSRFERGSRWRFHLGNIADKSSKFRKTQPGDLAVPG